MSTEASGDGSDSFLVPPIVHLRKHNCTALPLGGADGSRDGDDSVEGAEPEPEEPDERAQMVLYRLREMIVVLLVDREFVCRRLDGVCVGGEGE